VIRRWLKRYDDGEQERWQDFLTSKDVADKPEPWSMPYAFLYHNGWDDEGCSGWPLVYQFATRGCYPNSTEWSWAIDPSDWTLGLTFFKDTQHNSGASGRESLDIKQVIFHVGPISLSALRYRQVHPVPQPFSRISLGD